MVRQTIRPEIRYGKGKEAESKNGQIGKKKKKNSSKSQKKGSRRVRPVRIERKETAGQFDRLVSRKRKRIGKKKSKIITKSGSEEQPTPARLNQPPQGCDRQKEKTGEKRGESSAILNYWNRKTVFKEGI